MGYNTPDKKMYAYQTPNIHTGKWTTRATNLDLHETTILDAQEEALGHQWGIHYRFVDLISPPKDF